MVAVHDEKAVQQAALAQRFNLDLKRIVVDLDEVRREVDPADLAAAPPRRPYRPQ